MLVVIQNYNSRKEANIGKSMETTQTNSYMHSHFHKLIRQTSIIRSNIKHSHLVLPGMDKNDLVHRKLCKCNSNCTLDKLILDDTSVSLTNC